jgi:hypothetical protein
VSGWIKIFRLIMACTANGVQLDRISDLPAGRQVSVLRVRGSNPLGVTDNLGLSNWDGPFFLML